MQLDSRQAGPRAERQRFPQRVAVDRARFDVQMPRVVGEAHSDYQGFIEGSLNIAEMALRTIPPVLEPQDAASEEPAASGRS